MNDFIPAVHKTNNGVWAKAGVKNKSTGEVGSDKKSIIRSNINEKRDIYSLVADSSNTCSLLLSMVSALYMLVPEETKTTFGQMAPKEKERIEYTIAKFSSTTTRADLAIEAMDKAFIDKLINNQADIAKVISDIKGETITDA